MLVYVALVAHVQVSPGLLLLYLQIPAYFTAYPVFISLHIYLQSKQAACM